MSHDGGSSCKSYIKHPTEKERLDNLAFTSFPEDYLPYTSSYHRKAPYLVWDDGFRPHRKRRLKRWRQSRACRCCTAAALTAAIALIIIGILSIVAVSIYLGVITSLFRSPILSLSAKMTVTEGDEFTDSLLNTTSYEFLAKAETYQAMLENMYLSSSLEPAFVAAKVYAFRKGNLTVFFRIYLDRRKLMQSDEETLLIARNVVLEHAVKRKPEFSALSLDLKSIEFRENNNEEQTPEMDFELHEEAEENGNKFSEETEHSLLQRHPPSDERKTTHQNDVQKPTPAQENANPKTSTSPTEVEEHDSTLHSHSTDDSESATSPSHIVKHEKTVFSEHPVSEDETAPISYGQWQPLVPVRKDGVESSSTKRPPPKENRRVSGSGSVHLVEELFIPVVAQMPSTRGTPVPEAGDPSKPQPNVASSIMSSVSLVILPSSRNRTVMVSNNKNKVIETVQQAGSFRPLASLHSNGELGARVPNISLTSTRNQHASLRYIEDYSHDRNMNTYMNKGENVTSAGSDNQRKENHFSTQNNKTVEQPSIAEGSSKLNSEDSKIVESKMSSKTPLTTNTMTDYTTEKDTTEVHIINHPTDTVADKMDSFSVSTEYLLLTENTGDSNIPAASLETKSNKDGILNFTLSTSIQETIAHESDSNKSQTQFVVPSEQTDAANSFHLLFAEQTTDISEIKGVSVNNVTLASTVIKEINLKNHAEGGIGNEQNETETDYDDAVETTTAIFVKNMKIFINENDSDSSGSLDTDYLTSTAKTDNPKLHTMQSHYSQISTEIPKIHNKTTHSPEFPKTDSSSELTVKSNDSQLFLQDSKNREGFPDSAKNVSSSSEFGELSSTTIKDEFNGQNSSQALVIIKELESSTVVEYDFVTSTSIEESTMINESQILDFKPGGLPKIVPPFTNTQYIPNDIHSNKDIQKDDENDLDDQKLFPVTFSDIAAELPNVPPSDKPETGVSKDHLNNFQPPDDENVVVHHITTPLMTPENDSTLVGLGKYPTYFLNECADDEVACRSGECIPADYQCNMRRDCRDNSDEEQCSCIDNLKVIGQIQKICDGIQDCWDLSDEENCPWCAPGQFICPQSKLCIEMDKVCDGSNDCPHGTDERYCVKLAKDENSASRPEYQSTGYLMIRKQGQWGKLCLENLHTLAQPDSLKVKLGELGRAVCSALSYKEITEAVETKDESEAEQSYFEISTQSAKKQSRQYNDIFLPAQCDSKSVVHVTCKSLECGMRPMAFSLRRRIVGGQSTSSGSWPWQVALYKEGDFQCGAVLVSDMWLISAGHCFYSSQNSHWTARLGVLRRGTELPSPSEQVRRITHIFIHPEYVDKGFINDIALLKMDSPIPFSDFLRPLCLPNETEEVNTWNGHHCSVVGWGKLYEIGHTFPDSLQEVRLPVISTEECRKKILFLTMYHLTDNMFCAGYERGGRDACLGDSGGPLMCQRQDGRWVLLGVTSNGDGCGRPGRPGVYTKVTKYLSWINQVMDGDLPPERPSPCSGRRCNLGHCVSESKVCDGRWDCSDGSDEMNCFV